MYTCCFKVRRGYATAISSMLHVSTACFADLLSMSRVVPHLHAHRNAVPVPVRLGDALAEAGPSITLAAAAETLAFALGGLTSMPAVRNFALCAALAIFLDFLLQVGRLPSF